MFNCKSNETQDSLDRVERFVGLLIFFYPHVVWPQPESIFLRCILVVNHRLCIVFISHDDFSVTIREKEIILVVSLVFLVQCEIISRKSVIASIFSPSRDSKKL
jgi:hypothetical protein